MRKSAALLMLALLAAPASAAPAAPAYRIAKTVPLGAPDSWDYVVFDPVDARVYVAHGNTVSVVDSKSATLLGTLQIGGGTHGIAAVHALGKGYTDDGKAGVAVVFDLKTLKVLKTIKVQPDADGIVYDRHSGHVLVIDGDSGKVTVIDPKIDTVLATVDGGGGLEFGVSDEKGKFYVDGADKNEIVRIDTDSNSVDAHWPLSGCTTPHGLAMDRAHAVLFASCANKVMSVVDARTGKLIATVPIGEGTDFAMFDAARGLAFSSNRDGTLSVIAQTAPGTFTALPSITTAQGARTMGLDPKTGRIFLATAEMTVDPAATDARHRYRTVPGSAKLLFLDPAK